MRLVNEVMTPAKQLELCECQQRLMNGSSLATTLARTRMMRWREKTPIFYSYLMLVVLTDAAQLLAVHTDLEDSLSANFPRANFSLSFEQAPNDHQSFTIICNEDGNQVGQA